MLRRAARSTLFPYTTLFRSHGRRRTAGTRRPDYRGAHDQMTGAFMNRRIPSLLALDRKSTRLNSSHGYISYAVFCLKKKNHKHAIQTASDYVSAVQELGLAL